MRNNNINKSQKLNQINQGTETLGGYPLFGQGNIIKVFRRERCTPFVIFFFSFFLPYIYLCFPFQSVFLLPVCRKLLFYMYCVFMFCQRRGRFPLPRMRQKWKAARELKRAGLFIREVYSDLCRFLSRKFGVFLFHLEESCARGRKLSSVCCPQGTWGPKGFRGKRCSVLSLHGWILCFIADSKFNVFHLRL